MNPADTGASAPAADSHDTATDEAPALPWEAAYDPTGRLGLLSDLRDLAMGNSSKRLALAVIYLQTDSGKHAGDSAVYLGETALALVRILSRHLDTSLSHHERAPYAAAVDAGFAETTVGLLSRVVTLFAEAAAKHSDDLDAAAKEKRSDDLHREARTLLARSRERFEESERVLAEARAKGAAK